MPRGKRMYKKLLKKINKSLQTSIYPYITIQNHTTPTLYDFNLFPLY